MAKIKLLESRSGLTGSVPAGAIVEFDDKVAERIVGMLQAEYVDDPDATIKAREKFGLPTIEEVLSQPETPSTELDTEPEVDTEELDTDPEDLISDDYDDQDSTAEDSEPDEDDSIEALDVDDKVVELLKPSFETIDQLAQFIDDEGDLTELEGIGKATADKIVAAVNELYEYDEEE